MKKKLFVSAPVLLFLLSLLVASCSGSKSELAGTWQLSASKLNQVVEEGYTPLTWTFKDNGRFVQIMNLVDDTLIREGDFTYDRNEGELQLHFDTGSNRDVLWVVVHLDEEKLMVEYTGYGFFVEREFVKLP